MGHLEVRLLSWVEKEGEQSWEVTVTYKLPIDVYIMQS